MFDQIASRQSGQMQMDVYLKGHCGDPIRIDRKKQRALNIPRPALTVGVMLQPDLLRTVGQLRQFRGRGLLARFLYALPESRVGRRKTGDAAATPVPKDVADQYNVHMSGLVSELAQWVDDPAILSLTRDARAEIEAIELCIRALNHGGG